MATIRRWKGGWQARYRDPSGRQRSRSFPRKIDAERFLASTEVAKARGEWLDPALGRITFAEWADQWSTTIVDLRPSTVARDLSIVRAHLLPKFGRVPLANVTTPDVRAFIAELVAADNHSPATVRKIGQVLSKIMNSAVEAGYIGRSPCTAVRLPAERSRQMRFLTPEEVARLADVIDAPYRLVVLMAVYSGLRWGELAGLRRDRVNVLARTIHVIEQLTEVGGKLSFGPPKTAAGRRKVMLPRFLAEALGEHMGAADEELVFNAPEGGPLRRSNFLRRVWLPAVEAAGLDGLRFHDLRHTAVALAIAQGAHPKAIQERMGHSSVMVTLDRYGHLFEGLDERIADGLDDVYRNACALVMWSQCGPGVVPAPPVDIAHPA